VNENLCSLLVVDDEPFILSTLASLLQSDFHVLTAGSAARAMALFADHDIDIVLSDQRMPKMSGVQLLEWVKATHPKTIRLLMTGFAELQETVDAINKGQVYRYLFKPWRAEELLETLRDAGHLFQLERSHERLLEELRRLNLELENRVALRTRELAETNHELEQKNQMLERLALTDPLTGLSNRRAMDRLAERELHRRDRYPAPLTMGVVDVDHFKHINDRFLLPGGDAVLMDLARVLAASVRTVDFVGRIGGEEFMVIAPETDMEGAKTLGERIRSAVERAEFRYRDFAIPVRVSIGFAVAGSSNPVDYEAIKHAAAGALAEAKAGGRNRCVFFTPRELK